jgi:hypothetical protein
MSGWQNWKKRIITFGKEQVYARSFIALPGRRKHELFVGKSSAKYGKNGCYCAK